MILKVFAIYDLKSCAYLQPWVSVNSLSGMRAFGDILVKDPNGVMAMHPSDFQLFEVGTFDDNSGSLSSLVPMKLLCMLSDFIEAKGPVVKMEQPVMAANGGK